ncbi:MAG TPA: polymer-forming cytoskeletal protein [Gammaproteobacteria bacterium]|nr:polymer-forming cytoskeletal protein [Gammaproteobacteria bacterium]
MWGNSGSQKQASRVDTLVGRHTEVRGDVRFSGGLHVDGRIVGNVIAEGDDAVLSVSEHGAIEGEVTVSNVVLNGSVNGDVRSSQRIELSQHAKVAGDVYYNLIEMAMGASVNGQLVHQSNEEPLLALHHEPQPSTSPPGGQAADGEGV